MKRINKLEFGALKDTSEDNRIVDIQVKSLRKIISKINEVIDRTNSIEEEKK